MIIVDDASEDYPYEVIKKYEGKRLKYIHLQRNQGYSHAKNVAIKIAKAEILVMLDADDMLTKNGISIRYKKLKKGYDFVHGRVLDYKNNKTSISRMWDLWIKYRTFVYVHAQGVMLKKNIHRKIGLYDENLKSKSDREFFARVFNYNFRIGVVKENVALYRRHKKQMHRSKEKLKNNNQLQKKVLNLIKKRKKDLSGLLFLE